MTIEELRADFAEEPPAGEEFELAEGRILKVGGVPSYGRLQELNREAEATRIAASTHPVTACGKTVPLTSDVMQSAVMVAAGVYEPKISVRDAVRMSVRYPLKFAELLAKVVVLSGIRVDEVAAVAETELAADPFEPPSSESVSDTSGGTRKK